MCVIVLVRDRPFNLQGGFMVFCFVQNFFFRHVRILIFFLAQSAKFFSRM